MSERDEERKKPRGVPSNSVYDRVGDDVKVSAHHGVQRGKTAQDIIRDIAAEHGVRLNVGELRMLLAARRTPDESTEQGE